MSRNISFSRSNVADVGAFEINADATVSATTANNTMTFVAVVAASKGAPNTLLEVTADDWKDVLGKPFHSNKGLKAEGLRHISEAVKGGSGYVVRVVPDDATYPVIRLSIDSEGAQTLANDAVVYGTDVELADGEQLALYIVDGAESDLRELTMEVADSDVYGDGMFKLTLTEEDDAGNVETLETHYVSFGETDTDDMGSSTFIETVLEQNSDYLEALVGDDTDSIVAFAATAFTGASNGDIDDITTDAYLEAVTKLSNTMKTYNFIIGAGIYEQEVIEALITVANNRRIGSAFDVNPRLSYEAAVTAKQEMGLNEHRACFYHMPFTSIDPFHKNRCVWGLSGRVFAAKAAGVATTSPTGSWHKTPAGTTRATINRTKLKEGSWAGEPDYDDMYTVRINKLGLADDGSLFIDDSITSYKKENYLRFEQVVSIADAMTRQFVDLGNSYKHEPDEDVETGLTEGMTEICDNYVSIGALVTPRDTDSDGTDKYAINLEQLEIDSWQLKWSFCPSGSARRIFGEPVLIK